MIINNKNVLVFSLISLLAFAGSSFATGTHITNKAKIKKHDPITMHVNITYDESLNKLNSDSDAPDVLSVHYKNRVYTLIDSVPVHLNLKMFLKQYNDEDKETIKICAGSSSKCGTLLAKAIFESHRNKIKLDKFKASKSYFGSILQQVDSDQPTDNSANLSIYFIDR